ncbi:TraB/GumN family protein [Chitinophaga alhagiae]|uniref:TraB/GumN family protein n=1 Tax=Chitinophaga alhagiae TaxID=2203219 RepID=UPI000E5A5C38|nr:TraB/GumN family protein [Chitinophaga alhagiae]
MLKKFASTLLLALTFLAARSQNALLYKISGNGLQQPSYLYGTIHLICPEDLYLSPALKDAMAAARELYLEIDMDDPAMMATMGEALKTPEGYDLAQHFKPGDFDRLAAFMKDSLRADITPFRKMKPLVVQMMILQRMATCPLPASYEQQLVQMATTQQKPVQGLEKVEDQVALFDAIPDSTECRMIMEYVNNFQQQRHAFNRLVAAYKRQDVAAMHQELKTSPELAGFEDLLVYDRNRNWVPVMEKAMRQGTVLVACGAMHLGGEQGLPALLKARGYQVTPVP